MIDVPSVVRERALANSAAGRRWLDELPAVVDQLAAQWELTVGATYRGGTAAYVAEATRVDGSPCVLKVGMPLDLHEQQAFQHSVAAMQIAQGRGCVALLEHDADHAALLLERLGANLDDLEFTVDDILRTVANTLNDFWRPVPADCGLTTGEAAAHWLADFIVEQWEALDQPCERTVIDQALRYCGTRADAFGPKNTVLVHGDAHGWNTLVTIDEPVRHKFVDIEGLASEPAHDLAVPMREYNEPLLDGNTARLVRERAADLSGWCDVDPDAIWQWGFIERVSTGLANVRDFHDGVGELFLEVASRCVD